MTKSAEIAKQSKIVEAVEQPAIATASSNIPNEPKIESVLTKESKETNITDEIPVATTPSSNKVEQKIATPNLVETTEPIPENVVLSKNLQQQSAIIKEIERPQLEGEHPNTEEKKFFKVSIVSECKCICLRTLFPPYLGNLKNSALGHFWGKKFRGGGGDGLGIA